MIKRIALAALALMASPAHAAWQEADSKHFVVYSDDQPEAVRAFTTKLERYDQAMRVLRGWSDVQLSPTRRVTVYIVPNESTIQRLSGQREAAGFYIPRAAGAVAFVPRRTISDNRGFTPLVVLLHEYAHHFMYINTTGTSMPLWVTEGFAEFNSTAHFDSDGGVTLGAAPLFRIDEILDSQDVPADLLLTATPSALSENIVSLFYGRAWLLTHYVTFDTTRRRQFGEYLAALGRGTPSLEAAKVLIGGGGLDARLNTYISRAAKSAYRIAPEKLRVGDVSVRALGAGEAAVMPARIQSETGVSEKTAPSVAATARTEAAPFSADAGAQNELAEAEYDAGNYAAAADAADRAIAADPRSLHALLYAGMARAAAAKKAGVTDPAKWQAIRAFFIRANRLDPEAAYPLALYFRSFVMAKQEPSKSAEAGLIYAQVLAPYDLGLSVEAARVLLKQNKIEDAGRILQTVASNPHGGSLPALATKALAALSSGGAADALRAMTAS